MRKQGFWFVYLLLVAVQLLVSNYLNVTPYVMLSLLPVMVLCIPIRVNTFWTMCIALATALAVDYLSEGIVGLNALALVPVAFARKGILRLVFGDELFAREEDFSVTRNGFGKVATAIFLALSLFLAIYVWADGVGMRPLWFNLARFGASLAAGFLVALLVIDPLAPDARR